MNLSKRHFLVLTGLALGAVAGCGPVTPPTKFPVTATISAATLANDCGDARPAADGLVAGDCAPEPAAPAASTDAGAGFRGGCGGFCQQSNVQIAFAGGPGTGAVAVGIVTVRLLDATTNAAVATLTARSPEVWNGTAYVAWDQQLPAATSLRTSYKLSAIDWTAIGGGNAWSTHSRRFVLEVVLTIDGVEQTIRSSVLAREPEVVT